MHFGDCIFGTFTNVNISYVFFCSYIFNHHLILAISREILEVRMYVCIGDQVIDV